MALRDLLPAFMRRTETPAAKRIEPVVRHGKRAFQGALLDRLTSDWVAQGTSQDAEVYTSLRGLRNRARQLVRDNDYAKNAKRNIQNNVVGSGMKLQPKIKMQRGDGLNEVVNAQIEQAWKEWCRPENCDVAGKLSFSSIERMAIGGTAESGEIFIRMVRQRFGKSKIPFALEVIEADQCIDTKQGQLGPNIVRMGVELDQWKRPVAYWFWPNHPGDLSFASNNVGREMRIPADEIVHLFMVDRPGQTRGVSWFHTGLKRLHHLDGYEEAEVVAQRASSSMMGFIETPEPIEPADDTTFDGQAVDEFSPGMIKSLGPGEKFSGFLPPRNTGGYEPFMRQSLRGFAAGVGASYETISKDYSQSNYSSSRLALLDDRDTWRVLQRWMIETMHHRIFEEWLHMAVLSGEVTIPGFEAAPAPVLSQVHFQARGWGFVDPEKEANAYKALVRSCFMSQEDVVEQGAGGGYRDFPELTARISRERKLFKQLDIVSDTDPSQVDDKGAAQKAYPTDAGDPTVAQPAPALGPDVTTKPQQIGAPPVQQPGGPQVAEATPNKAK